MEISDNTIERVCKVFGYLEYLEQVGCEYISSKNLAKYIGTTEYTVRKDISLIGVTGYDRKGYPVSRFKRELGEKLDLSKEKSACIAGLGRIGSAILDYEEFREDGFNIIAGFDTNINKLERIRTKIEVYPVSCMENIIKQKGIELGIIAVPTGSAQNTAERLISAGIKGILNFAPVKLEIPEGIIYLDMDLTNSLRFISAKLATQTRKLKGGNDV